MKKIIILLIILSVLIIQCSNEYSGESEKSEQNLLKMTQIILFMRK